MIHVARRARTRSGGRERTVARYARVSLRNEHVGRRRARPRLFVARLAINVAVEGVSELRVLKPERRDGRSRRDEPLSLPRNNRVYASDTESTNGTFIDKVGERIREVELKRGNTIILGDNVASFRYEI